MSIHISRDSLTENDIKILEKKLYTTKEKEVPFTKKKTKNYSFSNQKLIPFFRVFNAGTENNSNEMRIAVPFFFGINYFGKKFIELHQKEYNFLFLGSLRKKQKQVQEECVKILHEKNCSCLSVYPGFGKTITSLSIVPILKKKVLIVVNKLILLKQWKQSIEKFLGISPCIIGGKNSKLSLNHYIYLINITNLPKHDLSSLDIGLLILDEVHLLITENLAKGFFHVFPQYVISLSATAYRLDNLDSVLSLFIGEHRIYLPFFCDHNVIQHYTNLKMESVLTKNGSLDWNNILKQQETSKERMEIIVDYAIQYKKRKILILTKRIEHIQAIKNAILSKDPSIALDTFCENDTDFDEDASILISTYAKAGTGFSHDSLDMLLLGMDVEAYFLQYLGRIFRKDIKNTTNEEDRPLVVDLIDNHPVLKKHAKNREQVYRQSGGKIRKNK